MPSFAEIKQKTAKAKDATVNKIQNTKDRNTSVSMKDTNWNPYNGEGPRAPPPPRINSRSRPVEQPPLPPPPVRRTTSSAAASSTPSPAPTPGLGGPPPIKKSTKPVLPGQSPAPTPSPRPTPPALPARTNSAASSNSSTSLATRAPSYLGKSPSAPPMLPKRSGSGSTSSVTPSKPVPPALPSRTPSYQREPHPAVKGPKQEEEEEVAISWANLSQEDKGVFFEWLDEFFEKAYGIPKPTSVRR